MDLTAEGEILVFEENPTPKVGGFDFVFVDELLSGQKCSICLLAMRDPVQTMCGHRFCESCLAATFREGIDRICPHDRQLIPEIGGWFRDVAWEREILSLRVRCSQFERECDWIGQIRHYQEHFEVCQYEDETCKKCAHAVQRRFLETHTTTECPNRIVQCEYCEEEFQFWDTEVHVSEECARFPLDCPQQCGVQQIPREEVQSHLQDDCLMTMVECPYQGAECFYEKRSNLKAHLEASREEHLRKTQSNLLKEKERLDDVEDDIGGLLEEKKNMKARLNHLELSNSSLHGELQGMKEQIGELQEENESTIMLLYENREEIGLLKLSKARLEDENMGLKKDVAELRKQLEEVKSTNERVSRSVQIINCKIQSMQEKQPVNTASQPICPVNAPCLRPPFPRPEVAYVNSQATRQPAPNPASQLTQQLNPTCQQGRQQMVKKPLRPNNQLAKKRKNEENKRSNGKPEKTICRERSQEPNRLPIKTELSFSSDDKDSDEENEECQEYDDDIPLPAKRVTCTAANK